MKPRSCRLGIEALEIRDVPATVAYGDLNHDGRDDMVAITSPTTITVSLANSSGIGYTVSAVLTVPAKAAVTSVGVWRSEERRGGRECTARRWRLRAREMRR